MRTYRSELVLIGVLMVVAFIGAGQSENFHEWFWGTSSSGILTAAAPQLASQSYVRESNAAPIVPAPEKNTGSPGTLADAGTPELFRRVAEETAPALPLMGALVADLETGETYYSFNADRRWPIASVTKLMTAVEAKKRIAPMIRVTLGTELLSHIGDDSSATGLQLGEIYSADDLIKAMLVFSSNEAAEGLAESHGREAFLQGMRDQVKAWGLTETSLMDPTGLTASNQSTPNDLRKMLLHIYRDYPQVFGITRAPQTTLSELGSATAATYSNINTFARSGDFLGGKTGYTDEANGNLVSLFAYENRPIAVIVLGTGDRFGATKALYNWFKRTHTSK